MSRLGQRANLASHWLPENEEPIRSQVSSLSKVLRLDYNSKVSTPGQEEGRGRQQLQLRPLDSQQAQHSIQVLYGQQKHLNIYMTYIYLYVRVAELS